MTAAYYSEQWMRERLRKIEEPSRQAQCVHPQHRFPNMIVLEPGTWEYTCPACGGKTVVRVPARTC